ncbi:cyclic lactone autoinducer peptide [Clostridium kluyveri]|nr:cyclic lactone autoinducer peptide [Clostridium kluyveri]UZQ49404.1 cyclic lactone autoinducer peptide [Clostridium kluyveri]
MKSKIIRIFLSLCVLICTLMAFAVSASACFWGAYQPEEPEFLRK